MTNKRERVIITIEREIIEREEKKMFEKMMNEVIKRFGFESDEAILFCQFCEFVEEGIIKEDKKLNVKNWYHDLMEV